ncbi:hypothetical protein M413DRAFT_358677 [Hebeloma cylindrosporum]|uniref:Uncharacterized protein n=1 Tax=Hebeloma cylindrosporum TaxID=76867 RepID=A0A0C3CLN0_HEBCY|nr:hypothetical protein M413DRAFT_358677 [Hebeloma cylindrosporum h7]
MLHHHLPFVHYRLDAQDCQNHNILIISCTSYLNFVGGIHKRLPRFPISRAVSLLLNSLSRRTPQDLWYVTCSTNGTRRKALVLTSSKQNDANRGSLPTPTLPCHPPQLGWHHYILKICKSERRGPDSSMAHV